MENTWDLSPLWVGLALAATLLATWFKISSALSELVLGSVAQLVIGGFMAYGGLLGKTQWITFLVGTGAIVPTFLAGAELDAVIFNTKWRESPIIGLVGFFGLFLACTLIAHSLLLWSMTASWLCGEVLILAAIVSPEPAAARAELIAVLDNMRQRYERSFVAIRDRARLIEIELATDIAVGPPEEQILHMADSIQASLIPIGRPSHSAFHRWMLGSNPLRYVRCPVMGVHGDAESPS